MEPNVMHASFDTGHPALAGAAFSPFAISTASFALPAILSGVVHLAIQYEPYAEAIAPGVHASLLAASGGDQAVLDAARKFLDACLTGRSGAYPA